MIESSFEEAFSKEWVETQITDSTNELVIFRQVIPWQAIITQLSHEFRWSYVVQCRILCAKPITSHNTDTLNLWSTMLINSRFLATDRSNSWKVFWVHVTFGY